MGQISANGLFRATGNTAHVAVEREKNDFYPTPPEPTRAILSVEGDRLRDFPMIWEASCGDGAMTRELQDDGHKVFSSDLIDRGFADAEIKSFYDYKKAPSKAIFTNPPYCEVNCRDGKGRWIYHAMRDLKVEYMALLLSWNWAGAGGLASLWSEYPPARVYLMRWKIDFTQQGAPPMLNGWFVWDKKHEGETILRMLDRNQNSAQGVLI